MQGINNTKSAMGYFNEIISNTYVRISKKMDDRGLFKALFRYSPQEYESKRKISLWTKQTNTCRKAVKNTTMIVIYKVLVYIQISANYMFRTRYPT